MLTCALENNLYFTLYNFNLVTFMNGDVEILNTIFYFLLGLLITEIGVLKSPSIAINLLISPFRSVKFYIFEYL